MHIDLERIAADAASKNEQHFSFNNNQPGAQDSGKNGKKDQQLKMIQENDDSYRHGEDDDLEDEELDEVEDLRGLRNQTNSSYDLDRQNLQQLLSSTNFYK